MMHALNWAQFPYLSLELGYFVFRRIMRLHCEFNVSKLSSKTYLGIYKCSPISFSVDLLKLKRFVNDSAIALGGLVSRQSDPYLVVDHPP